MSGNTGQHEALYAQIAARWGGAIVRLAAGYEHDPDLRGDLEQEIHLQLWRSLALFKAQCALSTWVWRVAHAVCAGHVRSRMRARRGIALTGLDAIEVADPAPSPEAGADMRLTLERLHALIHRLRPDDRQVMLLYLEGEDARAIAEITGLSPGAVATRISRIKALLADRFTSGGLP